MQVNDDPSYLAGHFKTVREALGEMIPEYVVPIGLMTNRLPDGACLDLSVLKGICAGALAMCSASTVAAFNTDDAPRDVLNMDWAHPEAHLRSTELEDYEELEDAVAACYFGHIPPSDKMTIDLSTETFAFVVHVKRWVWPSADCDNLIEVHLEAEGGPPSLLFFTRRENNG